MGTRRVSDEEAACPCLPGASFMLLCWCTASIAAAANVLCACASLYVPVCHCNVVLTDTCCTV